MSMQDADDRLKNVLTELQTVTPPFLPADGQVMTMVVKWPPGDLGLAPHRHPGGPCFGYVLEGEMVFELDGAPPRVIKAGDAFWEPGGDVIHYQDGNNRTDIPLRYLVTMIMTPGQPMLVLVGDDELKQRGWVRRSPSSQT